MILNRVCVRETPPRIALKTPRYEYNNWRVFNQLFYHYYFLYLFFHYSYISVKLFIAYPSLIISEKGICRTLQTVMLDFFYRLRKATESVDTLAVTKTLRKQIVQEIYVKVIEDIHIKETNKLTPQ